MSSPLSRHPQSPSAVSHITLDSSYTLSPPSTPGTVGSIASTYSARSSKAHVLEKLTFWRKRTASAADVRNSMRGLQKLHRKHIAATSNALTLLREWADQLSAPLGLPVEWQTQLANPTLQELVTHVCEALSHVEANEKQYTQIVAELTSSFHSLSYNETQCKRVSADLEAARSRFYKERQKCKDRLAAKAGKMSGSDSETVAAGQLAVYENAFHSLEIQMRTTGEQYRQRCHKEMLRQFEPILHHMNTRWQQVDSAVLEVQGARRDYPAAGFGTVRRVGTPLAYGRSYNDPKEQNVAPLRYCGSSDFQPSPPTGLNMDSASTGPLVAPRSPATTLSETHTGQTNPYYNGGYGLDGGWA